MSLKKKIIPVDVSTLKTSIHLKYYQHFMT